YTTGLQFLPSAASDSLGNFVVVWQSSGQDGSGDGIFGQRYDNGGTRLGVEFQVNTYTPSFQSFGHVSSDPNGGFVVVWDSFSQDVSGDGVFAQRYDSGGGRLGLEFRVNSYTTGNQFAGGVASDASGNFVIVWGGQGQGDNDGVFGKRYDSNGV